jgi:NADH-quinone oxidoreductase subunit M
MPDPATLPTGLPLLTLTLLALPLGAALIWLAPSPRHARWIALIAALADLLLALTVAWHFDAEQAGFQLLEQADWIPGLNVHYLVGVDGISVLFLPLTTLLFIAVIAASWTSARSMPRLYYTLLLLLESATLGIFCSLDLVLFFLFWELTLIPLYFLIGLWGAGPHRRYAAVKYTLFMLAGGVPLLFGFLLAALGHAELSGGGVPAGPAWDLRELIGTPLPPGTELTVFVLLLLGFAAKTPLFPLHTWLPVVGMEGPASVAALMTGLKLGAYGLIRFAVPLAPDAAQELHWLLTGLGTIGILYGALAAMAQTNLRRMLAYASMSHVGLVVLGIASFRLEGLQGALFLLLSFTPVAGGLFLLTGFLQHRLGSTDLIALGGAAKTMPLLAALFFVLALASLGVPGTSGFPAELLILMSALQTHTGAGLAALFAMVLGAAYLLSAYRRTFYGPLSSRVVARAVDLRPRELAVTALFTLLVLLAGLYPAVVLDITRQAGTLWIERLGAPGS